MQKLLTIVAIFAFSSQTLFGQVQIKNSVVKIFTVVQPYNYQQPWQKLPLSNQTGSGFIIAGNRILTNAHVVADSKFIEIRKSGSAQKYYATVSFFAPEYDLAVLEVSDKSFFNESAPLEIGDLPYTQEKVYTCGYPIGGDELSVTEGIVSRIEHREYVTGKSYLLAIQIDASINPGNSGGPVLKGNKVVGVAFQGITNGQNIGYAIPTTVINHFLNDIADGAFDGIPHLGFQWQPLDNFSQRLMLGLMNNGIGIRVTNISPDSPLKNMLQVGDVILSIDSTEIASDGSIKFRETERTHFCFINQQKNFGDKIELKIFRNKKELSINTVLTKESTIKRLVPHDTYNTKPDYFIYGGLVFEPLSLNYLTSFNAQNWMYIAPRNMVDLYYNGLPSINGQQVVVLTGVLPDQINVGYHNVRDMIVYKVNGKTINNFAELKKTIQNSADENLVFEQANGFQLVLNKNAANKRNSTILQNYGIDLAE